MDPKQARREAFLARMNKGKETSSGLGLGFFKGDLQGVTFWQCKEMDHDIDIISYRAGPHDPNTPEGEWTYVLEVYEHRDVGGIEGQNYICMMKTYKKPCPVCEHRKMLMNEGGDEEVIKALRPSRYPRSIYNIVCYDDTTQESKGVQVFHTSHYIMEMYLLKLAESSRRDIEAGAPPYKFFADQDEGWSVKFTRTGQGLNTRFIAHQLVPRNYSISQEIMDQAYQLDTLIHIPTYEEVYAAFWGEEATPEPNAPTPAGAPAVRGGRGDQPQTAIESPAYDEQEAGDYVCPGGGTFGVDTYNLQHCEQCELWEPCVQQNEANAGPGNDGFGGDGGYQEEQQEQPAAPTAGRGAPTAGRATTAGGRGGGAPAGGRGGGAPAGGRGGGAPTAGRATTAGGRGGAGAGRGGAGGGRGNARPQQRRSL